MKNKTVLKISSLCAIFFATIVALAAIPAGEAQAMDDVDLSNSDFAIIGDLPYLTDKGAWDMSNTYIAGIKNDGASNHSPAEATHFLDRLGVSFNFDVARFHPKSSKSYSGKYGHKAYTIMDDSFGNKNTFKMLEVTDKSGDRGKKLRGTSKFCSGSNEWQRFEFEFIQCIGVNSTIVWHEGHKCQANIYQVRMRTEKTGNYITCGTNHGDSMHVANDGENIDLYLLVWQPGTWVD